MKSQLDSIQSDLAQTIHQLEEAKTTIESLNGAIRDLEELNKRWLLPWEKIALCVAVGVFGGGVIFSYFGWKGIITVVAVGVGGIVLPKCYKYFFGGATNVVHDYSILENSHGDISVLENDHYKTE